MALGARQRWLIYAIAAAITVVAVHWFGDEDHAQSPVVEVSPAERSGRAAREPANDSAAVPQLELDKLATRQRAGPARDLFAARTEKSIPREEGGRETPSAPAPPQAPPLPFTYMGKMIEDDRITVFLTNRDRNLIARAGDTLVETYRVDEVGDNRMLFTYLPLGIKQELAFDAAAVPAGARVVPPARTLPAQPKPVPDPRAPAESVVLALNAPARAILGQEFVVSLALPARNEGVRATVELSYDSKLLSTTGVGAASTDGAALRPDPGRALIQVAGPDIAGAAPAPAQVRFRVVATAPTTAQIGIESLTATNADGHELTVMSSGAHYVSIVSAAGN
jgi:hypothetical protein